jgi:asparagine synthase (glutamine-hydrolysing)
MFAFALYDAQRQTVFLARDRLGVKPLYYCRPASGGFVFASEVRALLPFSSRRVRRSALESFLAQGAVQGYETLFENIELLPPGKTLTLDAATGRELRRQTYWQLPQQVTPAPDRAAAVENLRETAREAVRLRLISDVPTGLFLSGGIDSAALLTLARETATGPLRTISLGFDVARFDESREAETTAASLGSEHTTIKLAGADLLAAMPRALAAIDQPTVDGLNTYVVSQAARRAGLTVALSGLGGDELFGGYASFTDVPRAFRARNSFLWRNLARVGALANRGRAGVKLRETLRRKGGWLNLYLLRRELFLPEERRALQDLPAESDAANGLPVALLADLERRGASLDGVNRISFFELELYMRNMLLRDADAFSMAAPIEYRVPLLDHKLVEAAFCLPGAWKRPDPRPKPLLIDLAGPRLPREVWQRPKRGFAFPWGEWFAAGGAFHALAREAVADTSIWRDLGLRAGAISDTWRRFLAGDKRISPLQILAFVTLRDYAARHTCS